MELTRLKNVAVDLPLIPALDSTSPASFKTGLAIVDEAYFKDGAGAWTALPIADTFTEIGTTGLYALSLTAAEMNHDQIMIKMTSAGMADDAIIIKTTAKSIDTLNDVSTGQVNAEVDNALNTALPATPTADSANDVLRNMKDAAKGIIVGTAMAGTLSTTMMTTDLTESTNDHFNGRVITWITGALKGQSTDITAYDGGAKKPTYSAVTEAPAAGDMFVIT